MEVLNLEEWLNLTLLPLLANTIKLGVAYMRLMALAGAMGGLVFAFLLGFIIHQSVNFQNSNEANLILFCTLSGWFYGLLLALLVSIAANICSQDLNCHPLLAPGSANLATLAIGIVPFSTTLLGAAIYWRSLRRRR